MFGLIPSHAKYQVADFTVPILAEPWHFIVPWPKKDSRLLAPIRPFQPPVKKTMLKFFYNVKIYLHVYLQ